jgi:hypothetical protein
MRLTRQYSTWRQYSWNLAPVLNLLNLVADRSRHLEPGLTVSLVGARRPLGRRVSRDTAGGERGKVERL